MTATALVAAVNDATHFKNGQQLAARLRLVPGQHSTEGSSRGCSELANAGIVIYLQVIPKPL